MCMFFSVISVPSIVNAEEANPHAESRMNYISSYSTELSISDSGVASVMGFVTGKTGVTNTYAKVTLQKNVSGTWTYVDSWEKSSDTRKVTVAETYQVSRGTYRTIMTCSANDETKTATSAERKY